MSEHTYHLASFRLAPKERTEGCGSCGMLVDPPNAFHPWLYCELFKLGVMNPAQFLSGQAFIPDPNHWGKDAPGKQIEAARSRAKLTG